MAVFSKEFVDEALKRLRAKDALGGCPRCSHEEFQILQGFVSLSIVLNTKSSISKTVAPSLALVCKNCGYTSLHNIGLINMMDWGDPVDEKK